MDSALHERATLADYSAAVHRFTDAIDRVIEQGRALDRRYEQFCVQHGLRSGEGAARLTAPEVAPEQRRVHEALLALSERVYTSLLPPFPKRDERPLPAAATRALASRNRI